MKTADVAAREAAHFMPVVKRLPVCAVEAKGSRLRDVEGREYIDLTSGWGVTCIGHCHPELVRAISEQAGRLMQTTNVFYNLPQLELIERLAAIAPGDALAQLRHELRHRGGRGRAQARAPRDRPRELRLDGEFVPRPHARRAARDRQRRSTARPTRR